MSRLWVSIVPHQYELDFWSLLDCHFTKLAINSRIWVVTLWPLLGLLLIAGWQLRREKANRWAAVYLAVLAAVFAAVTAAYNWPDGHFTRAGNGISVRSLEFWAGALAFAAVVVFQATGWSPARRIAPFGVPLLHMAPLPAVLKTSLADRFDLARRCGGERRFCVAAGDGGPKTAYDRVILCEYRRQQIGAAAQASEGSCGDLLAVGVPCIRRAR